MKWTPADLQNLSIRNGFRMRGESMTRLEVFSDAAFAFALTMLVVSVGAIPENYNELMHALKSIPAFAMSFAQLAAFWIAHRMWSSRFGMEDAWATFLTLVMIFTILVFVYPLRLIFSAFATYATQGWASSTFSINSMDEMANIFIVYGVGYFTLAGIVALLYLHALKKRRELLLNDTEILLTKSGIAIWSAQVIFALTSIVIAICAANNWRNFAGFVYFGLAIATPLIHVHYGKKVKALSCFD